MNNLLNNKLFSFLALHCVVLGLVSIWTANIYSYPFLLLSLVFSSEKTLMSIYQEINGFGFRKFLFTVFFVSIVGFHQSIGIFLFGLLIITSISLFIIICINKPFKSLMIKKGIWDKDGFHITKVYKKPEPWNKEKQKS